MSEPPSSRPDWNAVPELGPVAPRLDPHRNPLPILSDDEMAAIMEQAKRERELGLDTCPRCEGRNLYPKPMYGPNVLCCAGCGCRWNAKMRRAEAERGS